MNPKIDSTIFGSIIIEGRTYEKDILILLNGKIKKRKKKLSKTLYSSSHIISFDEAKYVYEKGAEKLIVGSGQDGMVKLSDEARASFKDKDCKVKLFPTLDAIEKWNSAKREVIGLFHIKC